MRLDEFHFGGYLDRISKKDRSFELPIGDTDQRQGARAWMAAAEPGQNTEPQQAVSDRSAEWGDRRSVAVQRIVVASQLGEIGNVVGRDFSPLAQPAIASLEVLEIQQRVFGGGFQGSLNQSRQVGWREQAPPAAPLCRSPQSGRPLTIMHGTLGHRQVVVRHGRQNNANRWPPGTVTSRRLASNGEITDQGAESCEMVLNRFSRFNRFHPSRVSAVRFPPQCFPYRRIPQPVSWMGGRHPLEVRARFRPLSVTAPGER